jgi:hypothetical protein
MSQPRLAPVLSATLAASLAPVPALAQAACSVHSGAQPPAVVELYTSEGCSSCPPADRWVSRLKGRGDVLALAFHVNYWDRLGWPDRFATAATTERQHQLQRAAAAPYVYTPQVVLNGLDLRDWSSAKTLPRLPATAIALSLVREGNTVRARVDRAARPVAGYWAVLEDGHVTRVKAGENAGETLSHDHVVVQYRPVPSWDGEPREFTLEAPAAGQASRRVVFVVTDPGGTRPLQAVALGC